MASELKPIADEYLRDEIHLRPSGRLHRLVARMLDTYIDDLSDERLVALERVVDDFRLTHADGERFTSA